MLPCDCSGSSPQTDTKLLYEYTSKSFVAIKLSTHTYKILSEVQHTTLRLNHPTYSSTIWWGHNFT